MAFPFQLPDLGYSFDALEPNIDARTMEIHHGKHHAGYTNKFNAALEGHPSLHGLSAEQLLRGIASLPDSVRGAVQDNGGGFYNHSLFWDVMTPGGPAQPGAGLLAAIERDFTTLNNMKDKFNAAAGSRFGSGWAWVVVDAFGRLEVLSTANQDSPLMFGKAPILGLDVWEHAYYLNYQNRRPDYVSAFWNVVNWDRVAARLQAFQGGWAGKAD